MKAYVNLIQQYISRRFFENQPNKIRSPLSEKASKGRFREPEKLQNHINEGKGKEKKKERGEEKKSNGCTLSFYNGYLTIVFGRKKLLDPNGPFGGNLFKSPARYFIYYNLMAVSKVKAIRTICKRVTATPYKNKSPYQGF